MTLEPYIFPLLIGGCAGCIAGMVFRTGFGVMGNVLVGLLGGVIGGWLFRNLGIHVRGEWMGPLVTSTAGAMVFMFFVKLSSQVR